MYLPRRSRFPSFQACLSTFPVCISPPRGRLSAPAVRVLSMGEEKFLNIVTSDSDADVGKGKTEDVAVTIAKNNDTRPAHRFDLDTGEEHVRFRRHWWQIWRVHPYMSFQFPTVY